MIKNANQRPNSLRDQFKDSPLSFSDFKIKDNEPDETPKSEEETRPEDSVFPSMEKDTSESELQKMRLTQKKDLAILNDAKVLTVELQKYCEEQLREIQQHHLEFEEFLNGKLKQYIEATHPGSTTRPSTEGGETLSLFENATSLILDTHNVWITLLREQYAQADIYKDIFKKLRLPQFRLPSSLEAWVKNTTVLAIERQRQERIQDIRKQYWASKQLTKVERNVLFKEIQKDMMEKTHADVEKILSREDTLKPIVNLFKKDESFKTSFYTKVHKLLQSRDDLKVLNHVPDETLGQVTEELIGLIQDYNRTHNATININKEAIGDFVKTYVDACLPEVREAIRQQYRLPSQPPKIATLIKRLKELRGFKQKAQAETETETEEEDTKSPPYRRDVETDVKQPQRLLDELYRLGQKTIEGFSKTVKQILEYLKNEDFVPALETLGKRWQQKHPEGTQKEDEFFTREGDGERLLLAFDQNSGFVMQMCRIITDFFTLAPGEVQLGIVRIAEMLGIKDEDLPEQLQSFKEENEDVSPAAPPLPLVPESEEFKESEESEESKESEQSLQKTINLSSTLGSKLVDAAKGIPYVNYRDKPTPEQKQRRFQFVKRLFGLIPQIRAVWKSFPSPPSPPSRTSSFQRKTRTVFALGKRVSPRKIIEWAVGISNAFSALEESLKKNTDQISEEYLVAYQTLENNLNNHFLNRLFKTTDSSVNYYDEASVSEYLNTYAKQFGVTSFEETSSETPQASEESNNEETLAQQKEKNTEVDITSFKAALQQDLRKRIFLNAYLDRKTKTETERKERLVEIAKRFHPSYNYVAASFSQALEEENAKNLISEFEQIDFNQPIIYFEEGDNYWLKWEDDVQERSEQSPTTEESDPKTPHGESDSDAKKRLSEAKTRIDKLCRSRLMTLRKIQQSLLLKRLKRNSRS